MKYKKGTFIVVPNIDQLIGKDPNFLSVFFWLCFHADEEGICYPSRKKLSEECNLGIRTIDKQIKLLEKENFIQKTVRSKPNSKENYSNLYQVMQMETLGGANGDTVTIPNKNYTHLTIITPTPKEVATSSLKNKDKPYVFSEELQSLWDQGWKGNKIIHNYFIKKKFVFDNRTQFAAEVGRCKPYAQRLLGYTAKQINDTMNYLETNAKDYTWKLSTVEKTISELVNRK